jgi:hypothetical protein
MDDFDKSVEEALRLHPGGKQAPPQAPMPTEFDAAVEMALKMHPKGSERRVPKVQQFLESTAGFADVTLGGIAPAAAPIVYAATRPFTSNKQAQQIKEDYLKYTAQPFGKAAGITESPYYKGEALNRLAAFVSEYADRGADFISQQTGVPKSDVQNMMETLGIGVGIKAAPTVARAGLKGAEAVEGVIGTAAEAVKPTLAKAAEKFTPIEVTMAQRALGMRKPDQARAMGSVGAAGVEPPAMRQANIESALASASPDTNRFVISQDQANINLPALQIKALEDKHGIQLTSGQRTGDTGRYAEEWNARGGEGNPIGEAFKDQPSQIAAAIDRARIERAPDINNVEPSALGQLEINGLAARDQLRVDAINTAYQKLSDENGGKFPIDQGKLEQNIQAALDKENALPFFEDTAFKKAVEKFYKDPSFQRFEAVRTQSANILRSNADGNTKRVAYIVRQEFENMPVFGEGTGTPQAIRLKKSADEARALVVERNKIIEGNPAYAAAIGEAKDAKSAASQGESINADKFHQKYVAGATPEGVRRLRAELLPDDPANQALIAAEFERAKNQLVKAGENKVQSQMFATFLKKNGPLLRETMGPEAFNDLFEIGILSGKIGKPEAGVFNYSNSYSALAADLAKQGLLQAGEAKLAMSTSGASIPLVGGLRSLAERFSKGRFQSETLNPMGGLTLQDIGKVNPAEPPLGAARSTYGPPVNLRDLVNQPPPKD